MLGVSTGATMAGWCRWSLITKTFRRELQTGFSVQFLLPLFLLMFLDLEPATNRTQERLQVREQFILRNTSLPIKQEEQLPLHKVHFGEREPEPIIPLDDRIPRPVLVLGTRVVEVLRGQDQTGQEDTVHGAAHALGDGWEPCTQTLQED